MFGDLAPVVSDPRLLHSRSTPRGAASFDVHATPAVTVHMIHSPATKPSLDARWPLDPDIEVVVTIDVTSRTVDDNQVRLSYVLFMVVCHGESSSRVV
uniref:Protein-arginine deiminase (PAD) N-terminal domain-containing protein n=1 Tax=Zonotrichia albicollis TaxID=44394 RepID=A0A8D2MD74_ZONAL